MALDKALQGPFENAYGRFIQDAIEGAPSGAHGPSEVGWLESFHTSVGEHLDRDLREAMRGAEVHDSVIAQSAFIHGNPFQILPAGPLSRRVEAGDLLLIGERYGREQLVERQALLLQMKVGPPDLSGSSTFEQALLYGSWPPVTWSAGALRALPGPHPRTPSPKPTRAAQFGILPTGGLAGSEALELDGPALFGVQRALAAEMAAVTRLAIGVDATPDTPDGWPRLVEDMLVRALGLEYGRRLPRHSGAIADNPKTGDEGGFLVVVVSTGPTGILD